MKHPRPLHDIAYAVVALALSAVTAPVIASPFSVRDQNPLLAGFALPPALPATLSNTQAWTLDATLAWANTALIQTSPRETLIVDAETREWRLQFGRTRANGFAVHLDVPLRETRAGSLDSFIDGWHDFFGLPEGARPTMPRDALRIAYVRHGQTDIAERTPQSGLGDVSLRIGKQLGTLPMTAWVAIKAPTGDADELTGSGSWDVSAALAFQQALASRYSVFAQAAATWMSKGERMSPYQRHLAWSAMAGARVQLIEDLSFVVQIDAHTAVFDSDQDFLDDAVALTLGGRYRLLDDWELAFGVTEDIAVESTSDVVFQLELKTTW